MLPVHPHETDPKHECYCYCWGLPPPTVLLRLLPGYRCARSNPQAGFSPFQPVQTCANSVPSKQSSLAVTTAG